MKLSRHQFLHLAAVAAALPAVSRMASAQTYPMGPVHLIVGYAAGGPTDIVARLAGDGALIRAFDPEGMQQAQPVLPGDIVYCRDAFDAAEGADALVLITEWNEFRALSPTRLRKAMRGRVLVDLRNVYDPVAMRQAGFDYHCVGRPDPAR